MCDAVDVAVGESVELGRVSYKSRELGVEGVGLWLRRVRSEPVGIV